MKKYIIVGAAFVLVVFLFLGFGFRQPKTAYVDINEIYNNFTLKKELESKLDNISNARKNILDSVKIKVNVLSNVLEGTDKKNKKAVDSISGILESFKQEYYYKEQNFTQDNDAMTKQYSDQIWKQLNQYVKDYGKENGYEYIFGADGSGAVMYAAEGNNITDELKTYVNNRYSGK